MKYLRIISEVMDTPWAIRPEKLMLIKLLLADCAAGREVSPEQMALIAERPHLPYLIECGEPEPEGDGGIAFMGDELRILPVEVGATTYVQRPFRLQDGGACECPCDECIAGDCADCSHDPCDCPGCTCPQHGEPAAQEAQASAGSTISRSSAPVIAVLPLFGTIAHRMNMFNDISGGTSTERFQQFLRSAVDDGTVKSIVLDINSPGGSVNGVPELADEIYAARAVKPIVAIANSQAASAAYYLGSQATEMVSIPSGEVGSIGVFAAHEDISKASEAAGVKVSLVSAGKYKTEANPFEPLSEEARTSLQEKVNHYYDMFVSAVARGRNTTPDAVRNGYGQGRMLDADAAKRAGLVDRVATFERTLKRLGAKPKAAPPTPERMRQDAGTLPALALKRLQLERELSLR